MNNSIFFQRMTSSYKKGFADGAEKKKEEIINRVCEWFCNHCEYKDNTCTERKKNMDDEWTCYLGEDNGLESLKKYIRS